MQTSSNKHDTPEIVQTGEFQKSTIMFTSEQSSLLLTLFEPVIREITANVTASVLAATQTKEPRYYTRKEVATILNVTLPTLARFERDGILVSRQIGARKLYDAEAIDNAVKQKQVFKFKRKGA